MSPVDFPEANAIYSKPPGWDESQCSPVRAWQGKAGVGALDGQHIVVVAWWPDPSELAAINAGQPIFITMCGGLLPHFLSTSFNEASMQGRTDC